ncbi:MAG: BON domain-containing protein, partial [Terriglobales bacterium]
MKLPIRLIAVILALFPFLQSCAPLVIGAGVGAGVMLADDRRTSATILEDQTIEVKIKNRINEKYDDQLHVNITSFNRFVLLTGEAPTEEIKQDLTIVALEVQNVRNVQNEVIVAGNSSFTSRSSDGLLTSNIKGRLTQNKDVSSNHVKVVTENSTAFLMGLVTRAEAESAAQTAA